LHIYWIAVILVPISHFSDDRPVREERSFSGRYLDSHKRKKGCYIP
jgi:hypothetical protein